MESEPTLPGLCASCGLPGHRYGRNEGPKRYDPMACINSLRSENERLLRELIRRNETIDELVEIIQTELPEEHWPVIALGVDEVDPHYWDAASAAFAHTQSDRTQA